MSGFHTTRWTLIDRARGASPEARAAMSELCASYYAPVVAFLGRAGRTDDDARELAHEFFARVLAGESLGEVARERGRFRSYLLGAVKHFLANHRRDAAREKRGAGAVHLPIGAGTETSPAADVRDESATLEDAAFDRAWALAVVERGLAALAAESAAVGEAAQFAALAPWLTPSANPGAQTDAAAQLGMSEGAVKVAIHRLRRRFRAIVRAEIARTLHDDADIDDEMRHLVKALGTS